MPARDNPRDQGAVNQDREFEDLLRQVDQYFEAERKPALKLEPPAGKKSASAA